MNFVFVSLQRINTDRESTSTSLAKELARNHNVLFVNPPIDRRTYYSKTNDVFVKEHINQIQTNKAGLTKLTDNLHLLNTTKLLESINWIPSTKLFSIFNYINNRRFAHEIKKALKILNFESFILINDKDIFRSFYLKELLNPDLYIYLDRDYTLGIDYWKRHGIVLEPKLMVKSDMIVTNSYDFMKNAKRYNDESFYIGNGVDTGLFDDSIAYERPKQLGSIAHPVIGYVGALNSIRLDLDLLLTMATRMTDFNFVFIGEEDDMFSESPLHSMGNVHFLGKIDKKFIPPFVKYFDVCINPQLLNEITIGNFPLKIVEYLALGKPVVATSTNTMKEVFVEYCYLATTPDEFIHAIRRAIGEDSPQLQIKRVSFAKEFRWSKVASLLLSHIAEKQQ
jgi:teichuronic acid biosynthesis glycosyltransferase TuaH